MIEELAAWRRGVRRRTGEVPGNAYETNRLRFTISNLAHVPQRLLPIGELERVGPAHVIFR